MGRVFTRLEKQVSGRRVGRDRYVTQDERIRNLEVAMLEVLSFHVKHHATDKDNPSHNDLVAAAADFKSTLERVLGA